MPTAPQPSNSETKPPADHSGACLGRKTSGACRCRAFDFHTMIGVYRTCWCGHTENIHAAKE